MRGNRDQLFMSYHKSHQEVSRETLSRWLKTGMKLESIQRFLKDIAQEVLLHPKRDDVPINEILQTAGWRNCSTFKTFYDKVIIEP